MLDIKLATLLTVAKEKNFTKAAERLSLTQPAVSHHIGQLEDELGTRIFTRSKSGLHLTPEGEIILRYAERLQSLYDKMLAELSDRERHMTKIRVGITHTAESNLITEILAKYGSQEDNVTITIHTDTIKHLYNMLATYQLDLAFIEGKPTDPSLNHILLDTDYRACVLPVTHSLASHSMISLNELKNEQMILRLPSSGTRKLFEAALMSINESIDSFNITLEVDNIATIKDLIRKELGVSILPKSVCMDELKKGKLAVLPIENLSMPREMNLVYNRNFSHTEILRDLVQLYREEERKNV